MNDNLIPCHSEKIAREKGRKGGIASGESKRRKKAAREWLSEIMAMPIPDGKRRAQMTEMGIDNPDFLATSMVSLAVNASKGDLKAMRMMLELIGDDPRIALRQQELQLRREQIEAMTSAGDQLDKIMEFIDATPVFDKQEAGGVPSERDA